MRVSFSLLTAVFLCVVLTLLLSCGTSTDPDQDSADELVIRLTGKATDSILVWGSYRPVDPGATASDPADGNLSASITVSYSAFDSSHLGNYPVIYSVENSKGEKATVTRNVVVYAIPVDVEDDIGSPTTWKYGNVYVVKAWELSVTATLTIEPGVIVMFTEEGPNMIVTGGGVINAVGTAPRPIIFTSYKDDDHPGDINRDGRASAPGIGDWGCIDLDGSNGSRFTYCRFYYGGESTYKTTVKLSSEATAAFDHCLFAWNNGGMIGSFYHAALDANGAGASTSITNCVFYRNVIPLSINLLFGLDNSNSFHHPDSSTVVNDMNGVFIDSDQPMVGPITWSETEVAFVEYLTTVTIASGGTLTLGNDVVVKFGEDTELTLGTGEANIVNRNGDGVFFTSLKDDTKKGDTNGDGAATSPADGDWIGIADGSATVDYFSWPNILYAAN